jgi:hypothetical protein
MVGRIKISRQADATRHLFMDLEKNAKKIKTCWFCGFDLSVMKLANQGYLAGNHDAACPFEPLAIAAENCIKLRDSSDEQTKAAAEKSLAEKISDLLKAMMARTCPFPICHYTSGHRLECPFHSFERDARPS